ncbi:MAG: hypothetical protein IKU42_07555 [Oscillospiraceae bacterium]|nr:hypothetical protein [Oscillospiraceae bacterium]
MTGKIFKDKRIVFALSILLSFVLWLVVSLFLRPTGEIVISGVGVNVNVQSGILGELGLSAIEGAERTVDVTISGQRSVIGGISAEDISISPSLSGVTGAGIFELELRASNNSSKEFEIVNISPSTIIVKFDKYIDKIISVEYIINGEYNIPDEYIQEEIFTDPKEIVITGPEIDISTIDRAVVEVELNGDFESTFSVAGELVLVDKDGEPVAYNPEKVTLSDYTATVNVPVHKMAKMPISFDYINVPAFFDTSKIRYSLSTDSIIVEGEDYYINKYSEFFVGYVDMSLISLDNPSFRFNVILPEGLTIQDYVDEVNIDFDLEGYVEREFNVTQINIINDPKEYKVTSNAQKISVKLIGPEDVIDSLSAKDIVVEVDMSTREISQTGQYRVRANVFLPGGENAWAIGDYSVTITAKAR